MTEEEAWAEATRLNRELGERNAQHQRTQAAEFYVAAEVEPGRWEAVLQAETPREGFLHHVFDVLAFWR